MDNGESSYRRYLDGDETAFALVQEEYFDPLTFFIHRYVHDVSAAEDLAIDSLVELIVHKHRYRFQQPLKTYLFSIGRHKALDYIRRRNRIRMVSLEESGDPEDEKSLEADLLASQRQRAVNTALKQLPEQMQIAIHLVYFEELSYEDAGKVMGKSKKQVDNLLYRGKAMLRSILGKESDLL